MNLIKTSFLVLLAVFVMGGSVAAQTPEGEAAPGAPVAAESAPAEDAFDRRLDLAEKMQALNPARKQVDSAIEKYVATLPQNEREVYRAGLRNILNYQALEKISVDAYAETFTEAELAAMVAYYSKPEAISARDKHNEWGKKVYPEIVRMLDKAMMRVKTGGSGP